MPKSISFIPHRQRLEKHKVDYLRAMSSAMDYPYQAEDGRDLAPIQRALADKCVELSEVPYWSFTNCGTDSLQIAIHALTKEGDTILVPAYGWRGVANAVRFMNRKLKFIDVDKTGNICPIALEKWAKVKSNYAKAIIIIHNFGAMADVPKIHNILKKYYLNDIKIIEDAAPAFYMGAPIKYKPGQLSDLVCYSFDFTKGPGTLGSGGGIATRNADIYERIYEIQAHGSSIKNEVVGYGTKSFLDNTSCAVLLKEIEFYEEFKYRERRIEIAAWYNENLPYNSVPGENYIWERFSMFVPSEQVVSVLDKLHSINCLARTMFKEPMSSYSFYDTQETLPGVKHFTENLIHLPSHHYITFEEQHRIRECLKQ